MASSNKRDYKPFKEQIQQIIKDYPNLKTNSEIARKLIELGADRSENHLRLVVASYLKDHPRETFIEANGEEEPRYKIQKDEYIINASKGAVKMSIDLVDELFFDYSEHGRDLSQIEIINKYDLKVWEWNAIKSRLWLYKKSNIYSPYTVEQTPQEDLKQMIADKLKSLTDNMGQMVEREYSKHILREAKKTLKNNEKLRLFEKFFLLTDRSENQAKPKVVYSKLESGVVDQHEVICISDPHFGAKTVGSKILTDYDREVSIDWMNQIAENINQSKSKNVSVLLGGDYIESFTGTNHANSFQGMEYGVYGKKAYFNAVDILTSFLGKINNLHQVIGVSGNHDRGDGNNKVDPKGEIGLMILEQIKRNYQGVVPVLYDELVIYSEIDGIGYGLTHGHHSISKKKGEDLTYDYGNNKIYNVWIQGHLHEFKVIQNSVKVMKVVAPSIMTGNFYSESLGFNSNPAYLSFVNNGKNKAKVRYTPIN